MKASPKVTVQQSGKNVGKILADIQGLTKLQVLVGIPEAKAVRPTSAGDKINNAQLAFIHTHGVRIPHMRYVVSQKMKQGKTYEAATAMYIHTYGSPLYNVPPRPIIEPAIVAKGNKEKIDAELKQVAIAMLNGDKPTMLRYLHRTGMTAQNVVRAWFNDPRNNWAPNSPETIRRKKSSHPLIDTGELRKSISYVVLGT